MAVNPRIKDKRDEQKANFEANVAKPLQKDFDELKADVETRWIPDVIGRKLRETIVLYEYEPLGVFIYGIFLLLTGAISWQFLPNILKAILPYMPYSWIELASIPIAFLIGIGTMFIIPSQEKASNRLRLLSRIPFAFCFATLFFLIINSLNRFPPLFVLVYSTWVFCFTFLFGTGFFGAIFSILRKIKSSVKSFFGDASSQIKNALIKKILNKLGIDSLEEKAQPPLIDTEFEEEVEKAEDELIEKDKNDWGLDIEKNKVKVRRKEVK